jgi:hypothetical protein
MSPRRPPQLVVPLMTALGKCCLWRCKGRQRDVEFSSCSPSAVSKQRDNFLAPWIVANAAGSRHKKPDAPSFEDTTRMFLHVSLRPSQQINILVITPLKQNPMVNLESGVAPDVDDKLAPRAKVMMDRPRAHSSGPLQRLK